MQSALLLFFCWAGAMVPAAYAQAQKANPPVTIQPASDQIQFNGFTIRLIPTLNGYYGFDILKQNKLLLHQYENPIPGFNLVLRDDALATAKWMLAEYQKSGRFPRIFPPDFERSLPSATPR